MLQNKHTFRISQMKINLLVVVLFLLVSGNLIAQTILKGVVTDSMNVPIPNAVVYLSKTTIGVLTNDKGAYSLTIPEDGAYELIGSCVGYKSHSQIIKSGGIDNKIDIQLSIHAILIKEVLVKGKDRNRRENYKLFVKCFMGKTINAPYCTIENSKDLIVYRDSKDSNLIAYSVKPLIITNSALGYKIIYDLKSFRYNLHNQHLSFLGDCFFQDISNHKRKNSNTKRRRLMAYYGSRLHFLRALYSDSISQENFKLNDTRKDSMGDWKIIQDPLPVTDLRVASNTEGMTLYHSTPLVVTYKDNHPELYLKSLDFFAIEYSSVLRVWDSLQVYKNGYYSDAYNLTWSGHMSKSRIAEMLPFDYVPK